MRIVTISDTHCQLDRINIPSGDILIHAGDLTYRGDVKETSKELFELSKHRNKFKHIVLIEGNHDWLGFRNPTIMDQLCNDNGITLLRDSGITIDGVNFWGSPWQPEFCNWSWNLPRGQALKDKWAQILDNTQVLITHGPPMGILDPVERFNRSTGLIDIEHVGCLDLYNRIQELPKLRLHVFGHLHLGHGHIEIKGVDFINASICSEDYKPINLPQVISI